MFAVFGKYQPGRDQIQYRAKLPSKITWAFDFSGSWVGFDPIPPLFFPSLPTDQPVLWCDSEGPEGVGRSAPWPSSRTEQGKLAFIKYGFWDRNYARCLQDMSSSRGISEATTRLVFFVFCLFVCLFFKWSGVLLRCRGLKIWCCHYSNLVCCSGAGSVPDPETSICHRCHQKKLKEF